MCLRFISARIRDVWDDEIVFTNGNPVTETNVYFSGVGDVLTCAVNLIVLI